MTTMGYAEFDALLKKINLKPKGVKEIVLEVSDGALAGKIDMLSELIDSKISIAVDSQVVRYNIDVNARTQKPIKTYRVDDTGFVSEVKPEEGEQLEMNLGLPKEKTPIEAVPQEISREVIDEFILEGFAPNFNDLPYSFIDWLLRMEAGDSYSRIATDEGLSSGVVVEKLDEYRKRVAPLAAKWDEWREGAGPADAADPDDEEAAGADEHPEEDGQDGAETPDDGEDPDNEPGAADPDEEDTEPPADTQHSVSEDDDAALLEEMEQGARDRRLIDQDTPDWLQEGEQGGVRGEEVSFEGESEAPDVGADEQPGDADAAASDDQGGCPNGTGTGGPDQESATAEVDKEALDAFILSERPVFPEVEFDGKPVPFADLLEKRLNDKKTWRDVANENGMSSGQLSARWSEYKKLAAKKMQGGGGAA